MNPPIEPERVAEIADGLTKAQQRTVLSARHCEADGAWWPEGYYCSGDRRVRYNLASRGVTRDYLRQLNRLTPLGLAVRDLLRQREGDRG